jgi:hypothetical protein
VAVYSEDIGNTFGPKGFSIGSSRHVSSSKYPKSYCMKVTSQSSIADLGDADVLSRQGLTEVDPPPLEANPPAVGDRDGRVVKRVGQVLESPIGAR